MRRLPNIDSGSPPFTGGLSPSSFYDDKTIGKTICKTIGKTIGGERIGDDVDGTHL